MTFNLAILCALEIEAVPIINSLQLSEKQCPFDKRLGFRFFASARSEICLLQFGKCPKNGIDRIGTQIAALAAWETVKTLAPAVIASVGTAGGFKAKGASIGDVFVSDGKICFHGRHIPVPKYKSFETGDFPSHIIKNLGVLKKGRVSSGDSVPISKQDHDRMLALGTDAKDMEAAAIAEVAYLANVPMLAVKAISDFVDSSEQTHSQFMANFKEATDKLAQAMNFLISNNNFG
jgi:5'-methylthioadenosine nucleosidase